MSVQVSLETIDGSNWYKFSKYNWLWRSVEKREEKKGKMQQSGIDTIKNQT